MKRLLFACSLLICGLLYSNSLTTFTADYCQDKISAMQHEVERLQKEKELLECKNHEELYLGAFIFCMLITCGLVSYSHIKKQYRRIYRRRLKSHAATSLKIIKENEQIIEQYAQKIRDLTDDEESAKEQIAQLRQKIQILVNENKRIREDSCAGGIYVLEQLKKNLLIVENMTQKEKSLVFAYMDLLFGNFVSRLKEEYGLNENNLMLSVLVKLGFSSAELMSVFQCKMNSVLKKKQRLKSELCLGRDVDLGAFLTFYPLPYTTLPVDKQDSE